METYKDREDNHAANLRALLADGKYHSARLITISYPYNSKFVVWETGIPVHHVSREFAPWDAICYYIESK